MVIDLMVMQRSTISPWMCFLHQSMTSNTYFCYFPSNSKPFPAGEKVNLSGDDYLCDDCVQPVNDKNANVSAEGCK